MTSPVSRSRRRFLKNIAALAPTLAAPALGATVALAPVPVLPARAAEHHRRLAELLANAGLANADLAHYLVSEKLDGVRARWDGNKLVSRNGNIFAAPEWFVANFPPAAMDGELWKQRGDFESVSGAVRRKQPHDGWRELRFAAFDLPDDSAPFAERADKIRELVAAANSPFVKALPQLPAQNESALAARFDEVVNNNGEGLMLRRKDSRDNDDAVKLKPYDDADAVVVDHNPGKGKHSGRMGSLTVARPDGVRFRVGTGFSDAERESPPPLGATITYRHNGFTNTGLPRFPVFIRVRDDEPRDD